MDVPLLQHLESVPACELVLQQLAGGSLWTCTVSCCCHEKREREIPFLLNASKGLCLAPVLIKGEIYWSLCVRRKSESGYQIADQRQVLM